MSGRKIAGWAGLALAAALVMAWVYPYAFPLAPEGWRLTRGEAEALALERLRELAPLDDEALVITRLAGDAELERRLEIGLRAGAFDESDIAASGLGASVIAWEVTVYPPGAQPSRWSHRARVAPDGQVLALRLNLPPDEAGALADPADLRRRAEGFLSEQGIDPTRYEPAEARSQDLAGRTDRTLLYRASDRLADSGFEHGIAVEFAGDRLVGFSSWTDDAGLPTIKAALQTSALFQTLGLSAVLVVLLITTAFFIRRYHEGEIGVRAGLQILGFSAAASALALALLAPGATEGFNFGIFSRRQSTWVWAVQLYFFHFLPLALVAAVSWSVGESVCRERWGDKLAAFDALRRGRWANATVARSALRGVAAGLAVGSLLVALLAAANAAGGGVLLSYLLAWPASSPALALTLFALTVVAVLYTELSARLFLLPLLVERLGPWRGGIVVVALSSLVFIPVVTVLPIGWTLLLAAVHAAAMVFLFLRFDLLTTLLASLVSQLLLPCLVLIHARDPALELQGWLPLLLAALPLLIGLRHLQGGDELAYRYDDVPPHVRRIAERERLRVELETARGIQSSILPELPPSLAGVEIAHAYRPATEVGGDFYDVLALDDGRLAVAVGDVAGHGVSSGLIMSMAKSALAVQVTFDPEVQPVFRTLNRMVYQSARRRLLTTMCYALLDPATRRVVYASAGHLFPYRVRSGHVEALESVAYPLGAREELTVEAHAAELAPGDSLFLFSDGVVEARAPGDGELFGFTRLERSLATHAGRSAAGLRDGVLADLGVFTAGAPRADDQTILVLRLPLG